MPLLETCVAAIGRLALAAALDGPEIARVRPRPPKGEDHSGKGDGKVVRLGDNGFQAAVYGVAAAGWLSERKTLRSRRLDHDAKAAVTFKDALVLGAVTTGLANIVAEQLMKRRFPKGVQVTEDGRLSPGMDRSADAYLRYFKVMNSLNRVLVGGAVAATPFINFGLFNAYKPHPVRSFFKL